MEFITFKQDENLRKICSYLGQSPETFSHNTLRYLEINEWIADASDEWGKRLEDILNESVDPPVLLGICLLSVVTNDSVITDAFLNLVVVGKGDCPNCGDDLERFEDGGYGKTWEVERCSCGYYHSTEPAWDESYEDV